MKFSFSNWEDRLVVYIHNGQVGGGGGVAGVEQAGASDTPPLIHTYTITAKKLREGNVFTGVCLSVILLREGGGA